MTLHAQLRAISFKLNEKTTPTFNMNSGFQITGLFLAFAMIVFFYRHSIESILKTPKESFLLAIPIVFLGVLFYLFFKLKGF